MMKRTHKLFSALLAFALLLSLMLIPAHATSEAELLDSSGFTTQPQSGTSKIEEPYAFTWATKKTPIGLTLQILNPNISSEETWETVGSLSGTSGTVSYHPDTTYTKSGKSIYRIVALIPGDKTLAETVISDFFIVTWTANVTFDANGGTGTMASVTCNVGSQYTLPECGFTAPSGKMFDCWKVDGKENAVGSKITVSINTTVKAQWEDIPTSITITIKDGIASWTQIPDADEYLCKVSNTMYVAKVMPNETFDVDAWIKEHLDLSGSYTLTVRACKDSEVLMESSIRYEYTTTHTHLWSTIWSYDDTHHWRECNADGC